MLEVKLSIIVPCYNSESYIERCLESLQRIKYPNVELVLIDDGSTDKTSKILDDFSSGKDSVRVFHKSNGGYCSAINMGIELATGNYLMFLGSDDEIDSDGLDSLLSSLNEGADIVCFSTLILRENGSQLIDPITVYTRNVFLQENLLSLCRDNCKDARILFQRDTSRLFKRSVVGDTRYIGKYGVSADGCFSMEIALKSNSFQFMNVVCYKWHVRDDSVSSKEKTLHALKDEAHVWDAFFCDIIEKNSRKRIPEPIVSHIWSYWKTVSVLKQKDKVIGRVEEKALKKRIKEILRRTKLSLKLKFQLMFPDLYYFYLSCKKA